MEKEKLIKLDKFIEYVDLGNRIQEPEILTGGLMHTMYGVKTNRGKYAVKELNSSIMQRSQAVTNTIHSELIANELASRVPVVTALRKCDQCLIRIEGTYYMVFPWQNGRSLFPPDITVEHCKKIGGILGIIHSTRLQLPELEVEPAECEIYDWFGFLTKGKLQNSPWLSNLEQVIKDLCQWNDSANRASRKLNGLQVLSHRDLDPKNVMWDENEPYLIDWEAAGYVNPYQELLEVIHYWASSLNGDIERDKVDAFLNAYKKHYDISNVEWDDVIHSSFSGMLGWLAYSFRRSLGLEGDLENEQIIGTEQVFATIRDLRNYESKSAKLMSWLVEAGL